MKKLQLAFKICDLDSNNKIDINEMKKVIKSWVYLKGVPNTEKKSDNQVDLIVNEIFEKLDKNNDKSLNEKDLIIGCISHPELIKIFLPTI